MYRVHDYVEAPHQGGGSSSNLNGQDNSSIPHIGT